MERRDRPQYSETGYLPSSQQARRQTLDAQQRPIAAVQTRAPSAEKPRVTTGQLTMTVRKWSHSEWDRLPDDTRLTINGVQFTKAGAEIIFKTFGITHSQIW